MELTLINPSPVASFAKTIRDCRAKSQNTGNKLTFRTPCHSNSYEQRRKRCLVSSALAETAVSVVAAAVVVGAAATLLTRTAKTSGTIDSSLKICEDCGGSGICSECNGEGFILKKMAEGSADKARMAATNMATRYTAGLPKKWSYCSKCTSARSCSTCGGSGQINV